MAWTALDRLVMKTIGALRADISLRIRQERTNDPLFRELCLRLDKFEDNAHARGLIPDPSLTTRINALRNSKNAKCKYQIPTSLLVQTFMRNFRDAI